MAKWLEEHARIAWALVFLLLSGMGVVVYGAVEKADAAHTRSLLNEQRLMDLAEDIRDIKRMVEQIHDRLNRLDSGPRN